jgi:hypothetical protein
MADDGSAKQLPQMVIGVSQDKKLVTLQVGDIGYELDAQQCTQLLERLMFARTELLPAIDTATTPRQMSLSVRTTNWGLAELKEEIALALPHAGYGWISYRFPKRVALDLASKLSVHARGRPEGLAH